jgi:predicted enzyme related to lactoylglutathione lyase
MALETRIPRPRAARTGSDPLVAGVALFSRRPTELARFYEQVLRTSFTHRVHEDGREHWIVALGRVQLEIKALETAGNIPTSDAFGSAEASGTSRSELSFRVADVAMAVHHAVADGGSLLQPVETFSWGTFAVVLDPDGNRLGLFHEPTAAPNSHTENEEA